MTVDRSAAGDVRVGTAAELRAQALEVADFYRGLGVRTRVGGVALFALGVLFLLAPCLWRMRCPHWMCRTLGKYWGRR